MKLCSKCGETKDSAAFSKDRKRSDGLFLWCKACAAERHRKWYEDTADIRRAVRAEYARKNRAKIADYESSVKVTDKKKHAAHNAVRHAIDRGELVRQVCFICGEHAHAHHADYDRPLDVIWLCPAHHMQAHAIALE